MRAITALTTTALVLLVSCAPSQRERTAKADAIEQAMKSRFAEIEAEYKERISVATTNEEKAAVMQWQRDEFTKALREREAQFAALDRSMRNGIWCTGD